MALQYYYYHENSTSFFVSDIKDKYKMMSYDDIIHIGPCFKFNTWELYTRLRKRRMFFLIKEIYYLKYNKEKRNFE